MKISEEQQEILSMPVCQLGASSGFVKKTQAMGFETLRQVTAKGWGALQQHEQFDYLWFNELVRLLEDCRLLHMLEKH
ncbi:hypothetical protein ACFQZX_17740 [Mucilaginibacter litoreus]|uniref:Uncharacterized protein n=2 Tax=Mucilaginibacter litoreus TaxID=1048221 RepID=A0ABW3AYP4_9SPHI